MTEIIKNMDNIGFFDFVKKNLDIEYNELYTNSFGVYLKYGDSGDFIVNLDDIWQFLGYNQKSDATKKFNKCNFENGIDYIPQDFAEAIASAKCGSGGHNKITYLMTVDCFKEFCIQAGTEKAKTIRKYYVKLENLSFKYILQQKENELKAIEDKGILNEKNIISMFPERKECVYLGMFSHIDKKYAKFGSTQNLHQRIKTHKKNLKDFILYNVVSTENCNKSERMVKESQILSQYRQTLMINDNKYTEIFSLDNISIEQIFGFMIACINNGANSLEIEKERTKQIKLQEKTKQEQEKTKQLQIKYEMMKLNEKGITINEENKLNDLTHEHLTAFINDKIDVTNDENDFILAEDLRETYKKYITDNNIDTVLPSQKKIRQIIKEQSLIPLKSEDYKREMIDGSRVKIPKFSYCKWI